MITSGGRARARTYHITGVSPRRPAEAHDYAEALPDSWVARALCHLRHRYGERIMQAAEVSNQRSAGTPTCAPTTRLPIIVRWISALVINAHTNVGRSGRSSAGWRTWRLLLTSPHLIKCETLSLTSVNSRAAGRGCYLPVIDGG